jgi:hypothetical protein
MPIRSRGLAGQTDLWIAAPFTASAKYVVRKITEDYRDHQKGKW